MSETNNRKRFITTKEIVLFAMLGALMFCSKLIMEFLPNIHLLAVLTVTYTVVFRKKALFPIYVFVILTGVYAGFNVWWIPYLYLWLILWGVTMLLPQNMSKKKSMIVFPIVCALHGFLYGILYSPTQAIAFGMSLKQTVAWIGAGFVWDAVQGCGNLVLGLLVYPFSQLLIELQKRIIKN